MDIPLVGYEGASKTKFSQRPIFVEGGERIVDEAAVSAHDEKCAAPPDTDTLSSSPSLSRLYISPSLSPSPSSLFSCSLCSSLSPSRPSPTAHPRITSLHPPHPPHPHRPHALCRLLGVRNRRQKQLAARRGDSSSGSSRQSSYSGLSFDKVGRSRPEWRV